ncbi:hypothetical protein E2C01_015055 [Portunus trituberculatus]|uniref:Uncharacterized protein n=1 Tax=Portunus trituberculatus TaxID=210409 RepID=A0A5B7DKS9_PORTR|nr:hypothetical protein [Portunus trituberculatus]
MRGSRWGSAAWRVAARRVMIEGGNLDIIVCAMEWYGSKKRDLQLTTAETRTWPTEKRIEAIRTPSAENLSSKFQVQSAKIHQTFLLV